MGNKPSEETKKKISESLKGRKLSKEHREKISKALIGKNNPMYGKHLSNEAKKKISKFQYGKKQSKETREKISKALKGKNAPSWKGGYSLKNIPRFETYSDDISYVEKTRRSKEDNNILEIKCTKCKKWYIPKASEVDERLRSLKTGVGESRFYCSETCKQTCSIYATQPISYINLDSEKTYTSGEYEVYKKTVLERADNFCEYCGELAEHVHHIKPQKLEPFFALDPDYGLASCKKCHYEKGHPKDTECATWKLSNTICK